MGLCVTMLRAVDEAASAWRLYESDFAVAIPALGLVLLYFWCFLLDLFLGLFILHLGITFDNWLGVNLRRLRFLWLFLRFWHWLLRKLLLNGLCNFFHEFLDW